MAQEALSRQREVSGRGHPSGNPLGWMRPELHVAAGWADSGSTRDFHRGCKKSGRMQGVVPHSHGAPHRNRAVFLVSSWVTTRCGTAPPSAHDPPRRGRSKTDPLEPIGTQSSAFDGTIRTGSSAVPAGGYLAGNPAAEVERFAMSVNLPGWLASASRQAGEGLANSSLRGERVSAGRPCVPSLSGGWWSHRSWLPNGRTLPGVVISARVTSPASSAGWPAGAASAAPGLWFGEARAFSFGLLDRPGRMSLFYVAYRTYPQEQLLFLPAVGAGGGGFEGTGGWFASVGVRMLYLPRPRGYAVGLGVDYLVPLAGQAPRGWMVRLLIGGGER